MIRRGVVPANAPKFAYAVVYEGQPGETVKVQAVRGLTLLVERIQEARSGAGGTTTSTSPVATS